MKKTWESAIFEISIAIKFEHKTKGAKHNEEIVNKFILF